ncbi:MAG: hypothetical protein M1561_00770 [Gammaproteobacteria bacterium]|nr:hypothetical protein [Gammaproteobacteria bacterium]
MQNKKRFFHTLLLCTAVFLTCQAGVAATKTSVVVYKPSLTSLATAKPQAGDCWTNSIAASSRADAWRCMIDNTIYDPCFSTAKPDIVVCDADPANNKPGILVKSKTPLVKPKSVEKPALASAWMLKLADGSVCTPFTGTMPIIPEKDNVKAVQYGCSDSKQCDSKLGCENLTGLLADSIKPGATWMAKKIYYSSGKAIKILKIQDVKIIKVWQ